MWPFRAFKPKQSPPTSEARLKEVARGFKPKQSPESQKIDASLSDWIKLGDLRQHLLTKNIFIYGKIGFFEPVLNRLTVELFPPHTNPIVIHRLADIDIILSIKGKEPKPIVFMPNIGKEDEINSVLIKLIENNRIFWLIGYPSLIQKSLLSVFHTFFLACGATDIQTLRDIITLSASELSDLSRTDDNFGFFISDYHLVSDRKKRLSTLFRISDLE